MADVGISYSHHDTAIALALRQACIDAGLSVWMDDPGVESTGSDLGIPIGREHWEVIEREFAGASVILVIDSPQWRASEYCRREHKRCEEIGKWIAFVDPADLTATVPTIAARLASTPELFAAHARMASRVVAGTTARSWQQRWMPRANSADARTVLSDDIASSGLSITELIRSEIAADVAKEEAARRRLRTAVTATAASLAVLLVGAIIGWVFADRFSAEALEAQNRALALTLAEQSARDIDTIKAIANARSSTDLDPDGLGPSALAAAILADERLRTIELPPDSYVGGTWASTSQTVLVYSTARVVAVNTQTGEVAPPVAVDSHVFPGLLVAAPDATSAVYVDQSHELVWLDLTSGKELPLGGASVTAIDLSDDGVVWWASGNATLSWADYPVAGAFMEVHTVALPTVAKAIDLAVGEIAMVGDDATAYLAHLDGGSVTVVAQAALDGIAHSAQTGGYRASVSNCDGIIYGSYTPTATGTSFRWDPADGGLEQTGITRSSAPVCADGDAFSSDATRGDVSTFGGTRSLVLGDDTNRYFAVGDPAHERFAEVSPTPSRLYVIDEHTVPMSQEIDGALGGLFVFDDREWILDGDENLVDATTGEVGGAVPGSAGQGVELAQYIQRIGCDAIMLTYEGFFHVDCRGAANLLPLSIDNARGLRAGSDGKHFVFAQRGAVALLGLDGLLDVTVDAPWATDKQYIRDADVSPDGSALAVIDSFGVVHLAQVDDPTEWSTLPDAVPPGNSQIAYTAEGNLLILGSDRLVRLLDPTHTITALQPVPSSNTRMRVSDGVIVLSTFTGPGLVLDAGSLAVIERLPAGIFESRGDGSLAGLELHGSDATTVVSGAIIRLPSIALTPR